MNDLQAKLLDKNIIDVIGEVDRDMALYVREAIMNLIARECPPTNIYISSGGGDVDYGLDVYDTLMMYDGLKKGIVVGNASSMAAIILQACDKRVATKHATVLIHHISRGDISLDVLRDEEKLKDTVKSMEESQMYLYEILSGRTKKDTMVIKEECAKDKAMTAREALEFGLIDEILTEERMVEKNEVLQC